ncbi:MAG: hypothetical protein ACRDG7_19570 [Candidatus Limnocylindria bacterium]
MSFPLRITDAALFELELDEALVLAATCGYPERNPSLTQLVESTGLKRNSVKAAQDKLEACMGRPYVEGQGARRLTGGELLEQMKQADENVPPPMGWHRARQAAPLVIFDKPEHWYDREPDNPRYQRSNRITWIQPKYDPDHPGNIGRMIELPASVLAKIPRGRGVNAPLLRLLALTYAREQLRRGAIQIEDRLLADRFSIYEVDRETGYYEGLAVRQVERTREKLAQAGVIDLRDEGDGLPVYVMPGGTPGSDKTPDDFDPARTKRIRPLGLEGDDGQEIVASDEQHAELHRHIRTLGGRAPRAAELKGLLDPLDLLDAAPLIDRLSRKRHLLLPEEIPTIAGRDTGLLPSTNDLSKSSLPPLEKGEPPRRDVQDDFSGEGDEGSASASTRPSAGLRSSDPTIERREWSGDFPNLYYYADHPTHQTIRRFVEAIESRYGKPEAVGFLRWACLESTGSGLAVLELLRLRLPGVEPGSHDTGAGDVLLDLDIFSEPDADDRP